MKILLIDVNYGRSSTGTLIKLLQERLTNKGHEVISFFGRGKKVNTANVIKISTDLEVIVNVILSRIFGLQGFFSPVSTLVAKIIIKRFSPDVINLHDIHGYFINDISLLKYIKSRDIPVVLTLHSDYFFTGRCGVAVECNKWLDDCGNCEKLNSYPKAWLFDFSYYMQQRKINVIKSINNLVVTAPSEWQKNRAERSAVFKNIEKEIIVIPNILEDAWFKNCNIRLSFDKNIKRVLIIGSNIISNHKGGEWIYAIAKELEKMHCEIIIIGSKAPITFNSLDFPNLTFLGVINDKKKIINEYDKSSCTIIMSQSETFSYVAAESVARGVPVFGFDTGAIKTTTFGFSKLVPYGQLNDLIEKLMFFLNNEDNSCQHKRTYAMSSAHAHFNSYTVSDSYLKVFEEVINI
jgi:putative colanic acid biosynthesis glycosyltransferase